MTTSEKVKKYFSKFPTQLAAKGSLLSSPGEEFRGVYYLRSGLVRQYIVSPSGEQVVVNVFKQGAFFPMSWAINKTPNDYYYEVAEDGKFNLVTADQAIEFVQSEPEVLFDLLRRVYIGTDGLLARLTYQLTGDARSRLILELIIASKRFGKETAERTTLIKINQKDLAMLTGLTRETVTRLLTQLKDEGLLTYRRGLIETDTDLLTSQLQNT